jgi:hypothetical protein
LSCQKLLLMQKSSNYYYNNSRRRSSGGKLIIFELHCRKTHVSLLDKSFQRHPYGKYRRE